MQVVAKSPTWKGGLSFEPYSVDFNNQLKNSIIQYYNYKCQICFTKQNNRKLDVHHINYNKKDSREFNLISLCFKCHMKTNYNRNYWLNYFNNIKMFEVFQNATT